MSQPWLVDTVTGIRIFANDFLPGSTFRDPLAFLLLPSMALFASMAHHGVMTVLLSRLTVESLKATVAIVGLQRKVYSLFCAYKQRACSRLSSGIASSF